MDSAYKRKIKKCSVCDERTSHIVEDDILICESCNCTEVIHED
jgi:ribosomal protein L37AE/L43A